MADDRYEYGQMKDGEAIHVRLKPEVKKLLDKLRAGKSWSKFLEEVARQLSEKRAT